MTGPRLVPGGDPWLFAICLSRVGAYMVYIAYAATLPVLQREWQMSATAAGGIASSFQVAYAISLMGCSELADRVGARRVFLIGTLVSAVAAAVFALFARDYWSGLILYTVLALALGGTYTTGILLVAENVPVARRGRAMGYFLGGHSLGLAVALVLTGIAVPIGGYPLAFALICLGPVVGGAMAWIVVRGTPNRITGRAGGEQFGGAVLKNRPAMLVMASLSMLCSLTFGWLFGGPVWIVVAVGLVYGFTALGDSPIYSTSITEVVQPAFRGAALALRSLAGYGAGAAAPLVFGALLDLHGGVQAGRIGWGWAFASLGLAGTGAVASVMLLHRLPAARALTIGHQRAARHEPHESVPRER